MFNIKMYLNIIINTKYNVINLNYFIVNVIIFIFIYIFIYNFKLRNLKKAVIIMNNSKI